MQLNRLSERYNHWTSCLQFPPKKDGPEWESVKLQEKQLQLQEQKFTWAEKAKPVNIKLPKLTIEPFDGNYLNYKAW